ASSPWMKLLARRFDLVTGEFRGRDLPFDQRPNVRVTTVPPPEFKQRGQSRRADVTKLAKSLAVAEQPLANLPAVFPVARDATAGRKFSFSRLSGKLHRKFEQLDEAAAELE